MKQKISESDFDPSLHIKEYKRTCNECGKLWHSLVSREKQIEQSNIVALLNQASNACACNSGAALQAQRNANASQDSLSKLKSCPECGSQNYSEEVLIYEKKK